ncbi:MAG: gluconolactonase [Leptolyngbyaceae cyanobacterium SL_7_1]|nr:gluconolactonase [Leptolyngbyaceae cyanobacterium SL_7_1]
MVSTPSVASAQSLPPIYADAPVELAPARSIASFPVNTFLESVVTTADGTIYVTNHEVGMVLRFDPDGTQHVHATIEGKANGLALAPDGGLLLTAWNAEGVPIVVSISEAGETETLLTLTDAQFLNGITRLQGDRYLMADSYQGAIWEFDFAFDAAGNLYGATHIYNSVIRIAPTGDITTIAQAEQGMTGSTAIAFGQQPSDRTGIYVVTNGGMFLPPATGVVPAAVVWLEVE